MFVSMTGFSRSQLEVSWGTLTLEISSINHRYQEISVRLPREFASWEPWFHQHLRKCFRRGKIQARMEALLSPSLKIGRVNQEVLTSYCAELLKVQRSLGQTNELALETLLSLPGVLELPRPDEAEGTEKFGETLKKLIEDTVKGWLEMRTLEGGHLREEIFIHLAELEKLVEDIESEWLTAKEISFQTMRARVRETLAGLGEKLDEGRYLQEIVILADKWDVSEELARLKSHITKFRLAGSGDEPSGRKLDFIVQEMNREVNTLDSKIADAGIRWLAVNAKAALERIREQIQNLE